jgi:vitamin B12 transporter
MSRRTSLVIGVLIACTAGIPHATGTPRTGLVLSGCVTDASTGLPVPDAEVTLVELGRRTSSRDGGYFLLRGIPRGVYTLRASVIGYDETRLPPMTVASDTAVTLDMTPAPIVMDPVVVTATRSAHLLSRVPFSSAVLTGAAMADGNGQTAAEALESTGGVWIKDTGGFAGLKTMSIRGSGDSQVQVLLDGQKLNSAQDGTVDLSGFPIETLDRIEVVRGGHSALVGTDAVGGAVHLFTKSAVPAKGFAYGIRSTVGSFGSNAFSTYGTQRIGAFDVQAAVNRTRSGGDFSYRIPGVSAAQRRENNDFSGTSFLFKAKWNAGGSSRIQFMAHHASSDRGSADAVNTGFVSSEARRREIQTRLGLLAEIQAFRSVRVNAQAYAQTGENRYSSLFESADHENTAAGLDVLVRWTAGPSALLTAGAELRRDELVSTTFQKCERFTRSLSLEAELDHTLNGLGLRTSWKWIPAFRLDVAGADRKGACPKLGILIRPFAGPNFAWKASAGGSFRLPTFNDLYWPAQIYPGWGTRGNPDLRPETGMALETGFAYRASGLFPFSLECSIFSNRMSDLIAWMSDDGGVWAPRNVGRARINGIEAGWNAHSPSGVLDFGVESTWMRPIDLETQKILPYRPGMKLDVSAGLRMRAVHARIMVRRVGRRYTTADNAKSLPEVTTLNGNIQTGLNAPGGIRLTAKFQVDNAFDKSYFAIDGYPVPGREFRFSIGMDI